MPRSHVEGGHLTRGGSTYMKTIPRYKEFDLFRLKQIRGSLH